jgi:hypothetical protein
MRSARDLVKGSRLRRSDSGANEIGELPVPGQQFRNALGRMVGDPCEDVGEIGLRVDTVELCRLDQ